MTIYPGFIVNASNQQAYLLKLADIKKAYTRVGLFYNIGVPKGVRTPVTAVKGQCPRPLDDGD
jgi:hypothetical protein